MHRRKLDAIGEACDTRRSLFVHATKLVRFAFARHFIVAREVPDQYRAESYSRAFSLNMRCTVAMSSATFSVSRMTPANSSYDRV
jgi:hypothetical protein